MLRWRCLGSGDKPPANYMSRSVYDHGKANKDDLNTVVNYVRTWLFAKKAKPTVPGTVPLVVVPLSAASEASVAS